jgi:hypothetical protein
MIALQALAILESAVLECKQRSIDTPEVMEALNLLAPHIKWQWVIFRSHLQRDPKVEVDAEGEQLVLRATFPGIRDGVRELLGVRMDALAPKFHETHVWL